MEERIHYSKVAPLAYHAMLGLEKYLRECGLEGQLLHLIKLRTSQINGCAYCLDMHWKDLRAIGETEERLYSLDAWRESSYYSDRERAALPGPKLSPEYTKPMCPTKFSRKQGENSAKKNWLI